MLKLQSSMNDIMIRYSEKVLCKKEVKIHSFLFVVADVSPIVLFRCESLPDYLPGAIFRRSSDCSASSAGFSPKKEHSRINGSISRVRVGRGSNASKTTLRCEPTDRWTECLMESRARN